MARRPFRRAPDGALVVVLYPPEVELLSMTARDMMTIVENPPDGDVRDRLYPRAYLDPTEEEAQREYDALVHDDLVAARRSALGAIVEHLERATPNDEGLIELTLTAEDEMMWLTAVNDARLVIGTALGVTNDEGDPDYPNDDPRFEYGVLYGWLGELHFELVALLLEEIGEGGSDDEPADPTGDAPGGA